MLAAPRLSTVRAAAHALSPTFWRVEVVRISDVRQRRHAADTGSNHVSTLQLRRWSCRRSTSAAPRRHRRSWRRERITHRPDLRRHLYRMEVLYSGVGLDPDMKRLVGGEHGSRCTVGARKMTRETRCVRCLVGHASNLTVQSNDMRSWCYVSIDGGGKDFSLLHRPPILSMPHVCWRFVLGQPGQGPKHICILTLALFQI